MALHAGGSRGRGPDGIEGEGRGEGLQEEDEEQGPGVRARGVERSRRRVPGVRGGRTPAAGAGPGEPLGGGARSVVAVALAGLVDEGPRELLGAAGRALPGPVLPLQRLLAQAVPLRQLLGPLRPLRLPRLVQRRRLHRQRPAVRRQRQLRPRLGHVPAETAGSAPQHRPSPRQAGDRARQPLPARRAPARLPCPNSLPRGGRLQQRRLWDTPKNPNIAHT